MRRYLVVTNQTLGADQLSEKVRECMGAGPCSFRIVVPATPPSDHLTWTEGEASGLAGDRLKRALAWFGELGAEVDGGVGDASPMLAIRDALRDDIFDEIILSHAPTGDLPLAADRSSQPRQGRVRPPRLTHHLD